MITLYGVNYFLFERLLYFNEFLSLIGFILFFKTSFRKNLKFYFPSNTIYRCVSYFILLGLIYAIVSLLLKTNWYFYLRNLSIIYSSFTFFLGYHLYHAQYYFFNKLRLSLYGYALTSFALGWPSLVDRNAYSFWFAVLQKDWKILSVIFLLLLYILYTISYTSLTVVFILIIVFGVRFVIQNYLQFKIILIIGFGAFIVLFILAMPYIRLYDQGPYSLFGNVNFVYSHHPWFTIDENSSWRMIFWYRTVVETFPENLLGLGLGTPLIPYGADINTTGLPYNDEYTAHVIGTHNTFVTIFARFGIIALILFLIIYRKVFREFFIYKTYYLNHRNDAGLFLGFITLTVVGLFNLLIESPTLAGLFWISLGFIAKAINHRQYPIYELQNMQ